MTITETILELALEFRKLANKEKNASEQKKLLTCAMLCETQLETARALDKETK